MDIDEPGLCEVSALEAVGEGDRRKDVDAVVRTPCPWFEAHDNPLRYAAKVAGRRRPGMVRADLGVERRWRGGEPYAVSPWVGLGVEQTFTRNFRFGLFTRHWDTRHHEGEKERDPRGRSLGIYVASRIGPGALTARGAFSRETPERRDLRWTSREASLGYGANVGRDWSLAVRVRRSATRFEGEHPLFLKRREDRTHGTSVTTDNLTPQKARSSSCSASPARAIGENSSACSTPTENSPRPRWRSSTAHPVKRHVSASTAKSRRCSAIAKRSVIPAT